MSKQPGRARPEQLGSRAVGAHGEALAARWYEGKGYEILDRNWRRREGEIDLIVRPKTASSSARSRRARPIASARRRVGAATKQRRIRRLAAKWLSELGPASDRAWVDVRFDVVSISRGRVEVIEDAF